jgi:multidrug resistance efflux pump
MKMLGEQQTTEAEMNRLQYEVEKRLVRAPVAGRVAGLPVLRVGEFIPAGAQVGTIVPPERLRAVADFVPSTALGVIRPGQRAWIHLSGFPWTQYGSISAVVSSVASEPTAPSVRDDAPAGPDHNSDGPHASDKVLRVEMSVDPHSAPLIPLQYGLLGTAEVEVHRVSPARLIMRTVGRMLTQPADQRTSY